MASLFCATVCVLQTAAQFLCFEEFLGEIEPKKIKPYSDFYF
jgi:hypothetical protein